MVRTIAWTTLVGVAALAAAGTAGAVNCYMVLDRSDNVIYQGTLPPIDLSDKGQPERDAMRRRGEHMIAMESDRCIGVEFFTGSAGSSQLSVDQIVGGIATRSAPSSQGGPANPAAPAAAPTSSGSRPAPTPSVSTRGTGARY